MAHHRRGFPGAIGLLALLVVGFIATEAAAQYNCRTWLTAAQQEQARGNTQMAAEAIRIYRECVKQAQASGAKAGAYIGRNLDWIDPQHYGALMDGVANPPGPKVVRIPGYKPALIPGRPPGTVGGSQLPKPPGASGSKPPCAGGCPPGASTGAMHKSATGAFGAQKSIARPGLPRMPGATAQRVGRGSAFGPRSPSAYAARGAMAGKYAGRTTAGARTGLGGRSGYAGRTASAARSSAALRAARSVGAGRSAYAARSAYAGRSARAVSGGAYGRYRRQPVRRGRF
jgi:hypothetical protein